MSGGECSLATLAGVADVHVSAVFLDEQGLPETLSHSEWQGHSDSPLLAISAMVATLVHLCV